MGGQTISQGTECLKVWWGGVRPFYKVLSASRYGGVRPISQGTGSGTLHKIQTASRYGGSDHFTRYRVPQDMGDQTISQGTECLKVWGVRPFHKVQSASRYGGSDHFTRYRVPQGMGGQTHFIIRS